MHPAFDSETAQNLQTAYDEAVSAMEQIYIMRGPMSKAEARTEIVIALLQVADGGERDWARLIATAFDAMFDKLGCTTPSTFEPFQLHDPGTERLTERVSA